MTPPLPHSGGELRDTRPNEHFVGRDSAEDDETRKERLNRELDQLLNELRVALPGVQVLLAFLLTVPFTNRFERLSPTTRHVYFASVVLVALASILMIAPTVHHRLMFRLGAKERIILTANRLAIAGAICIALGLGGALYVAGDAAFPGGIARWAGAGILGIAAVLWFVVPFSFGRHHR